MNKKTLDIPLKSLIRECSLNPKLSFEHFNYFALKNRDNIHDIFKYKKFNNDFVSYISVYSDDNHFMGGFIPSYNHYLDQLIKILNANVSSNIKDDEELTRILFERINVLKGIKKESQLRYEFPLLYRDLIDGRKYYNSLQYFKKKEPTRYSDGEHYYYSCALMKSMKNFIPTQVKMYKRYIEDRYKLKEKYDITRFNSYIKKNFDLNKLSMYIIHEYLCACEISNDRSEIITYLEKIELYLNNNILDKTVKVYTDTGIEINYDLIKSRAEAIKNRIKSNDSIVNWVLIPRDRDYKKVGKSSTTKARTTLMNHKEIEKLHKVGTEKNSFYQKTNYVAKAVGLGKYKGYVGYIYENGEVILDMEYMQERPSTAKGNAIYNMYVSDFENLSKQSKRVLQNDSRVKRFCHVGNWKETINEIIEREPTESDKYNTNVLIKRLKRKALY